MERPPDEERHEGQSALHPRRIRHLRQPQHHQLQRERTRSHRGMDQQHPALRDAEGELQAAQASEEEINANR